MKTYPAKTSPDGQLVAFEVESVYVSPSAIARLLQQAPEVSEVKRRRLFSGEGDVHVRFRYRSHPCIVWEPYGDNSRYWVGPEDVEAFAGDLKKIERLFADYSPPMHRAVIGDLLSLRLFK